MIRGEYWIVDGDVQFADGDIGDYTHEGLAIEHVFSQWSDTIYSLAQDYEIEFEEDGHYDGVNTEQISELINEILEVIKNTQQGNPDAILMQQMGIDQDAYTVISGYGNAMEYVMKNEGWIAVRGDSVDLFGFDNQKKQSLINGLYEIFEQEGIDVNDPEENEVEFQISDHKTNKYYYVSLEDILNPQPTVRPQQPINTKGDRRFSWTQPDQEENKYSKPIESKPNPTNTAAKNYGIIGPGQQLWRGTSESVGSFKNWLSRQ